MPNLQQTDILNRQELVKLALQYFQQLLDQNFSEEKAKEEVLQRTGIVL